MRIFFNVFLKNIFLFLAVLGLHRCIQAFSSCGEQGLSLSTKHCALELNVSEQTGQRHSPTASLLVLPCVPFCW